MKTKEIRKMLCNALAKAEKGEMKPDDAKAVIGLANQIHASLSTEVKVATMKLRAGQIAETLGELNVAQ
jgi:hypothetical protein